MTEKQQLPKPKYYYDVKIECMLPGVITYRVLAETPQQAAEMVKTTSPVGVKHRLIGRRETKLLVYEAGTTMIKYIKNLLG